MRLWIVHQAAPQHASTTKAAAPAEVAKSIAVLPFVDMSLDNADEYLSHGATEEIVTALSKIAGLRSADAGDLRDLQRRCTARGSPITLRARSTR